MKIVHVITGLARASGVSTFVGGVGAALCDLGHALTVATVSGVRSTSDYKLDGRIKLISVDSLLHSFARYDVVHIHGLWTPCLHRVCKWAKRNAIPIIWSVHGMVAPWSLKHKWWKKFIPWFLYQKSDLRAAEKLHATVPVEEKWLRALGFSNPIVVAPLGTNLPAKRTSPLPLTLTGRSLLFVGRIYPVKGLVPLLKAWAMLPEALRHDWQLRLVGPDQAGHLQFLKSLCEELGLDWQESPSGNASVLFAGPKYGPELEAELCSCTCHVLPSYTENFGAPVIDALARGKPSIASIYTPWNELEEEGCGWWVDNAPDVLAETIEKMMRTSDAVRLEMGERGRKLVEAKYTWLAVAQSMAVAYADLKA